MTKQELVERMQQGQAWIPGKRVKIDFGGDQGAITLDGAAVVFALACFVGFQVIWNVSHALHTPLMAVTNAISGIIVLGALLQIGSLGWIVTILAMISVLIASINIVGGFLVTRRMLAMFQKS